MNAAAVKVGELFAPRPATVSPARYPDEKFELYSVPAYDRGVPDLLLGRDIGSVKQVVMPGDVLLSKIVPHIRRAWVVGKSNGRRLLASSEWMVLNSEHADPRYLRFLFTSDEFHRQFMATVGGVGGSLLRAQRDQVAQIEVSLPELDEQERVINVLEAASQSMDLESLAISRSIVLKAEAMSDLFTRGLRGEAQQETEIGPIPRSWNVYELGDLANITYGVQAAVANNTDPAIGLPILTNVNIALGGNIDLTKLRYFGMSAKDSDRLLIRRGDVLFNWRSGSAKHVGKPAYFDLPGDYTYSSFILRFRPKRFLSGKFLFRYLSYIHSSGFFDARRNVSSINSVFNASLAATIPVYFPDDEEQHRITAILDMVDQKLDLHKCKKTAFEKLFAGLLNGLMTGEISASSLNLSALEKPTLEVTVPPAEAAV